METTIIIGLPLGLLARRPAPKPPKCKTIRFQAEGIWSRQYDLSSYVSVRRQNIVTGVRARDVRVGDMIHVNGELAPIEKVEVLEPQGQ